MRNKSEIYEKYIIELMFISRLSQRAIWRNAGSISQFTEDYTAAVKATIYIVTLLQYVVTI